MFDFQVGHVGRNSHHSFQTLLALPSSAVKRTEKEKNNGNWAIKRMMDMMTEIGFILVFEERGRTTVVYFT